MSGHTRLIALTNQKGGVAKTTNTINIAGALAHRGNSVLVVDCDPQGYLTNRLGLKEEYQADAPTLYDAFDKPERTPVDELIVSHPEFDVLPSNIDMFRLEQSLIADGMKPRTRLRDYMQRVVEQRDYDYIVVDAPPSLGPINDNVLLATENVLIPCEAEDTSILALEHLFNQIDTLEQRYDVEITTHGIIISNVNYPLDNEQEDMIDWYGETFGDRFPVYLIRHRADIKRAMNNQGTIFAEDAKEIDMSEAYLQIADDLAPNKLEA